MIIRTANFRRNHTTGIIRTRTSGSRKTAMIIRPIWSAVESSAGTWVARIVASANKVFISFNIFVFRLFFGPRKRILKGASPKGGPSFVSAFSGRLWVQGDVKEFRGCRNSLYRTRSGRWCDPAGSTTRTLAQGKPHGRRHGAPGPRSGARADGVNLRKKERRSPRGPHTLGKHPAAATPASYVYCSDSSFACVKHAGY